jgi:hypothetical protein
MKHPPPADDGVQIVFTPAMLSHETANHRLPEKKLIEEMFEDRKVFIAVRYNRVRVLHAL